MVGIAARIRVSSVIFWESSRGTLRSALTKTFLPFKSAEVRSPTLFLAIEATPRTGVEEEEEKELILERTWCEKVASAAAEAKPKRRNGGRSVEVRRMKEDGLGRDEEEESDDLRREKDDDGAAVDAIVE